MRMTQILLTGGREDEQGWILPFGPLPELVFHKNKYYILESVEEKKYKLVEGIALSFETPE